MVALIQGEVVARHGWMTAQEFADLLAVSQMTPGPVGINTATYAGYTAVANAGYPEWAAVAGSVLASVAVVLVPVALVLAVSRWLAGHAASPRVGRVLKVLRLVVVGLLAAAALGLVGEETFGTAGLNRRFLVSAAIFVAVFVLALRRRCSPVLLILLSGAVGLVAYSI